MKMRIENKKLSAVLKRHDQASHLRRTFPEVLFDGVFYSENFVFRNLRDAAFDLGYQFKQSASAEYLSFPLVFLNEILTKKVIPVIDNVTCLRKLERSSPEKFSLSDLYMVRPVGCFLLHEAAHCVAYQLFDIAKLKGSKAEVKKLRLLKIMVGESYANTVECLAAQLSQERWIAAQNFYQTTRLQNFEKVTEKVGYRSVVKIIFGLFLYSNFLYQRLDDRERSRVFEFAEVPNEVHDSRLIKKFMQQIESITLNLNPGFRMETTQFYLKSVGFTDDVFKLCSFDPLSFLSRYSQLNEKIDELCEIVGKEKKVRRRSRLRK